MGFQEVWARKKIEQLQAHSNKRAHKQQVRTSPTGRTQEGVRTWGYLHPQD